MSEPTLVRPAKAGDASGIANVHVNAWREAYAELLPKNFLDQLPLSFKRRESWWNHAISDPAKNILFVAEDACGIVGFASFASGRDPGSENMAELTAVYLFEKFKGKGFGFQLVAKGFAEMLGRGFTQGYCWVLEGNPTIRFYEKSGAVFNGKIKDDEIGGKKVRELAYQWNDLRVFGK